MLLFGYMNAMTVTKSRAHNCGVQWIWITSRMYFSVAIDEAGLALVVDWAAICYSV